MSTGEGKPKVVDEKETGVYKRALDVEYNLRLKASRAVFSEISRNFPAMPFSVRALQVPAHPAAREVTLEPVHKPARQQCSWACVTYLTFQVHVQAGLAVAALGVMWGQSVMHTVRLLPHLAACI